MKHMTSHSTYKSILLLIYPSSIMVLHSLPWQDTTNSKDQNKHFLELLRIGFLILKKTESIWKTESMSWKKWIRFYHFPILILVSMSFDPISSHDGNILPVLRFIWYGNIKDPDGKIFSNLAGGTTWDTCLDFQQGIRL